MTENKLPTGVGKKIVEALKQQDNEDFQSNEIEMDFNKIQENSSLLFNENEKDSYIDDLNETDFTEAENMLDLRMNAQFTHDESSIFDFQKRDEQSISFNNNNNEYNFESMGDNNKMNNEIVQPKIYTMPSNVTVLKRLISQLPNGVTKQTGAQIIRQTMEALGISMNSVLAEAQQVQDGLNESIKDCMYTVNEYKQHIMTLEKQVSDYQKQVKAINDLVSLFILTEK